MPGTNGNSMNPNMEDLIKKFGGQEAGSEKIDKDKEFKEFEKVLENDAGKAEFIAKVNEDEKKVINLFDKTQLKSKIDKYNSSEKEGKQGENEDVKNAYITLGAYLDGKKGKYSEVLDQTKLEKVKNMISSKMEKNSEWSNSMKAVGTAVVGKLFAQCHSVEEFEAKSGTDLNELKGMKNIGDLFRKLPMDIYLGLINPVNGSIKGAVDLKGENNKIIGEKITEFLQKIGAEDKEIREAYKKQIETYKEDAKKFRSEYIGWEIGTGKPFIEVGKEVCKWGKEMFISFLDYVKEKKENVSEALQAAWEWTGKKVDKFMDLCEGAWEDVKEFWINLVKKGEIAGKEILEGLKTRREKAKDMAKALLEAGLIKLHDFADRCKGVGEKGKELLISILERNTQLVKDFVDRCTKNWKDAKEWFKDVCKSLLERNKELIKNFVDRCKNSWETVKEVACNVLAGLVKAGKLTLRVIFDALVVLPVIVFSETVKLLISAGKEIYGAGEKLAAYIKDVAIIWREKAKELGVKFKDWCSGAWETVSEWFVDIMKTLIESGNIVLTEFVDWCKDSWETLQNIASKVLVLLYKAGKVTLKIIFDVLIVIPTMTVKAIIKLLILAGQEIYKGTEALTKFIADLVVAGRAKAKEAGSKFVDFMKGILEDIKALSIKFGKEFASFFKTIRESLSEMGVSIADFIKATYEVVMTELKNVWDNVATFFINLGMGAKDVISTLWQLSKKGWTTVTTYALNFFKSIGIKAKQCFDFLLNVCKIGWESICEAVMDIKEDFVAFINYAKDLGKLVWENISQWFGNSRDLIKEFLKNTIERCNATIHDIFKWCGESITRLGNFIKEQFLNVAHGIKEFVTWVGGTVGVAVERLVKVGIGITVAIFEGLREVCKDIGILAKALWEKGKVAAKTICDWIYSKVKNAKEVAEKVAAAIADATSEAIAWIKQKIGAGIDEIKYLYDKFNQGVTDIFNWLVEKGVGVMEAFKDIIQALHDKGDKVIEEARKTLNGIIRNLGSAVV